MKKDKKNKPELVFHKGTQEPVINNISELAIWMESFKQATGMKDDYLYVGSTGLKIQVEKANTGKFAEKNEMMLLYLVPNENDIQIKNIWINKETGEKCESPEWFLELKKQQQEKEENEKKA